MNHLSRVPRAIQPGLAPGRERHGRDGHSGGGHLGEGHYVLGYRARVQGRGRARGRQCPGDGPGMAVPDAGGPHTT